MFGHVALVAHRTSVVSAYSENTTIDIRMGLMAILNKSECRRAIENDRVGYETRVDGVSLGVRWSCCGL